VTTYYEDLERLRGKLIAAGLNSWASRLLSAERGAATSGEALSATGTVLRELQESPVPMDMALREAVQSTLDEAQKRQRPSWSN